MWYYCVPATDLKQHPNPWIRLCLLVNKSDIRQLLLNHCCEAYWLWIWILNSCFSSNASFPQFFVCVMPPYRSRMKLNSCPSNIVTCDTKWHPHQDFIASYSKTNEWLHGGKELLFYSLGLHHTTWFKMSHVGMFRYQCVSTSGQDVAAKCVHYTPEHTCAHTHHKLCFVSFPTALFFFPSSPAVYSR